MLSSTSEYLTVRQAAEELGIPYNKLLKQIQSGEFPAIKQGWVWLIRREDIEQRLRDEVLYKLQRGNGGH